ncbi:MAG: flap endonuclease-1 [Candidatus Woesearchaeota archaeon]
MGVKITELVPCREIDFSLLSGKAVAIDASLFLYQFLTTIRQPDGTPLKDSKGRVTSHLIGLFSRTTKLMQFGILPLYVFDGTPPLLKQHEQAHRHELKEHAAAQYEQAVAREDVEEMRKFAGRTSRLTKEMIAESKDLLSALGIPVVEAPSEAEAQAAYIVNKKHAFAVATQDADALMFGAAKIVRNLSLSGKKKMAGKLGFQSFKPELVELSSTLSALGITQDQLVALCMIVGTDYNTGGIKGIGQKGALKLVKEHGNDFDVLFSVAGWDSSFPNLPWKKVFDTVKNIPITDNYVLKWSEPTESRIKELLVTEHNFSEERVNSSLKNLKGKQQKGLSDFF